jgi:hypothetical protein
MSNLRPTQKTKIEMTLEELERELGLLIPVSEPIRASDRIDAIIPPEHRRRVWGEFQKAGFKLPGLCLSWGVFAIAALLVLGPTALLGLYLRDWSYSFLTLVGLGFLVYRLTRPWAIHAPLGCETLQEAATYLTPFSPEDYKVGLWTREEVAAKVRQIFADAANVPVQEVKGETSLKDLFGE